MKETLYQREYLYRGRILNLRLDRVELENGKLTTREVVEHPGAVVILALDEANRVLLVQQYRHAVESEVLELPAGTRDKPGEPVEETARRELEEETGRVAAHWERLGTLIASPGILTERAVLFLARGLTVTKPNTEDDESVEVREIPLADALAMIDRGEIVDSKTAAGLLWAARKLGLG